MTDYKDALLRWYVDKWYSLEGNTVYIYCQVLGGRWGMSKYKLLAGF